ncbi:MAG: hypothetical protein LBH61_05760, partial [Dysgonamonadaceae bacterium]|nr:hypothetical protein [Dysgonamonadaceae bacterium]
MSPNKKGLLFPAATGLVYTALFFWSFRFCYFWDVIQQVSKEAHWYYLTNFSGSLLIHPLPGIAITPTGYHPPLISMITAVLWKIFGYELWVSHAFTFGCALLLIYHTWKLLRLLLPENRTGGTLLILLLESTVVTQFIIASPDFILLTAFVISLRAILQNKPVWLSVSLIFLCCANIRGLFTGILLFLSHFYYHFYVIRQKKCSFGECGKLLLPYLPAAGLLLSYFVYYFSHNGW